MSNVLPVPSDADLIDVVRRDGAGSAAGAEAFATLLGRHESPAVRLATTLVGPERAAGLVESTALEVARVLDGDGGPAIAFRPYLLGAVRRCAAGGACPAEPRDLCDGAPGAAFAALPERWQLALWHDLVEAEPPTAAGVLLGVPTADVARTVAEAHDAWQVAVPTDQARLALGRAVLGPATDDYLPDAIARPTPRTPTVRRHQPVVAAASVAALLLSVGVGVGMITHPSPAKAGRAGPVDLSLPAGPGTTLTPDPTRSASASRAEARTRPAARTDAAAPRRTPRDRTPAARSTGTASSPAPAPRADVALAATRSGGTVTWSVSGVPSGRSTTLVAQAGDGVALRSSAGDCTGSGSNRLTCTVGAGGNGRFSVFGVLVDTSVRLSVAAVSGVEDPSPGNNSATVG